MQRLRAYYVELILTGALLAAVAFFGYLGYGLLRPEIINEPFSGEKALANVEKLLAFGPRITGTESSLKTGDWLVEQLRLMGWDVVIQPFQVQDTLSGRNILAVRSHSKPGSPVAMLTTHYDTRLVADQDPDPANRQRPTLGANAGASGAAVLLELARTLDVEATGHTDLPGLLRRRGECGLAGLGAADGQFDLCAKPARQCAPLRGAPLRRQSGHGGRPGPSLCTRTRRRRQTPRRQSGRQPPAWTWSSGSQPRRKPNRQAARQPSLPQASRRQL